MAKSKDEGAKKGQHKHKDTKWVNLEEMAFLSQSLTNKIGFTRKIGSGIEYVDIRAQYLGKEGDWKPTAKGIMIQSKYWDDFTLAVTEIQKQLLEEETLRKELLTMKAGRAVLEEE